MLYSLTALRVRLYFTLNTFRKNKNATNTLHKKLSNTDIVLTRKLRTQRVSAQVDSLANILTSGFSLFYCQKIQDFSRTLTKNFPVPFRSLRMFKYEEKTAFTYNIQSVAHCRKFSMKQNVLHYCCLFSI